MACQLMGAVRLLSTKAGTSKAIAAIINAGKIADKAFGKLLVDVTGNTTPSFAEFTKKLGNYIREATGVTVTTDKNFILDQVRSYTEKTLIEFGRFTPGVNTITLGGYVSKEEVLKVVEDSKYPGIAAMYGTEMADSISNNEEYKQVDIYPVVAKIFKQIKAAKGTDVLMHELTHVGAAEYMTLNPEAASTKRINTIYNYLFQHHKELGIKEGYWKTSVDEFIAEAMSNKELVIGLMKVKPSKPLKRLSNLYEVVLGTLTSMLGLKKGQMETLFDILLDANVSILQTAGMLPEAQKGTQDDQTTSKGKSTGESTYEVPGRAAELFKVTSDTETEYNVGSKEAILLLIKSHNGIRQSLLRAGIDIKDC